MSFRTCFLGATVASQGGGWENGYEATGEADPDVTSSCDHWANDVQSSDTCEMLEDYFGITIKELVNWNPSLESDSCVLETGLSYCVSGSIATSSSAVVTATPVVTVTYHSTAAPVQSGITKSCTEYYMVRNAGDEIYLLICGTYSSLKGCNDLVDGDYFCVATKASTASSSSSSSFSTQTGWHFVSGNDTCSSIRKEYGVTPAEFYNWNPATGAKCTNLWLETYVCAGFTSAPVTKATMQMTTSIGAVVTSPVQSGIASNCTEYYKVQSGDTCYAIAQDRDVSAADFLKWNPAVGPACGDLEKKVYVCVAV
ncbi:hypothetical protein N7478_000010 [Penicillium angulare]|uniref:uncharacterized protein n=1 Tax=Penicillium angulare TaxID=116970 RepID=UPI002540BDCC|nr:uncharacterized protein N7478_000010 [Penicillium angulare]KAJ5290759.1 hypothetical protein N7478_000010 [Penicillium angulare]